MGFVGAPRRIGHGHNPEAGGNAETSHTLQKSTKRKQRQTMPQTSRQLRPCHPPNGSQSLKIKTAAMGEKASSHIKMNAISMISPANW
jgi:hypothetical protein